MSRQSSGRDAILNRIKQSLRNTAVEETDSQPKSDSASTPDALVLTNRFTLAAQAGGASVMKIANLEEVASLIVAAGSALPLSIAPEQALEALPWESESSLQLESDYKSNNCNGLAMADSAAAETGTVAVSTHSCPSGLLFLTERLFIVLRAADIKADYESIWALRAGQAGATRPRTLHLISGPSRTADVEQTIQIGAHGPRQLDILLLGN